MTEFTTWRSIVPAEPIPFTVIDDYEDGDLTEYAGSTGSFTTSTEQAYSGSYSLKVTGSGGGWTAIANENEDVSVINPNRDIKLTARYYSSTTFRGGLAWGLSNYANGTSNLNGYSLHLGASNTDFRIKKWTNGSNSDLVNNSTNQPAAEWIKIEVIWKSSGRIKVELFDASGTKLISEQVVDTTYQSGKIGWLWYDTGGYADYITKESI